MNQVNIPEAVLTKGKAGKLEVRTLDSRGSYVICKYLDPKTMKTADNKRKLILKSQDGRLLEYFIIPLKDQKRALLLSTESKEGQYQVWNETIEKAEQI